MKRVYVTAYPFVTVTGNLNVPEELTHDEIYKYANEHFNEIDFDEDALFLRFKDLDFGGTDFDVYED